MLPIILFSNGTTCLPVGKKRFLHSIEFVISACTLAKELRASSGEPDKANAEYTDYRFLPIR